MKKYLLVFIISIVTVCSASAQYYNKANAPAPKFGVGISSGFAVGAVSSDFPEAGAISLNLELPINKSPVSVLFTTGYTFYVSQGGYSFGYYDSGYGVSTYSDGYIASFIPVEVGLKVNIARRFFIEGYAGASFNVNSYTSDYTGKATAFIYSPGAGYTFPLSYNGKSTLDVGLFYESRPEPGGGYNQVAAKAVWNFNL